MNFGDKLLWQYLIIATSAFQPKAFSQLKRHFLTFFLNGSKDRRAISLSCTLNAHDSPKYMYLNGKHTVDQQKKKWKEKKNPLSIKLVLIGKFSLAVHGREFCVGVFHHGFHDIPVAFKQIATLSKLLIRHWAFSLLQKYLLNVNRSWRVPGPSQFLRKVALTYYTMWFKNQRMQLLPINCKYQCYGWWEM